MKSDTDGVGSVTLRQPIKPFGLEQRKTGDLFPPLAARPVTGVGVVKDQAQPMGDPFWGKAQSDSHQRRLATARCSMVRCKTVVEQTTDHRRRTLGHRRTAATCGSPRSGGGAGGGWTTSVDGELPWRKTTVGKRTLTDGVAVSLTSKVLLHLQGETAVRFTGLDGDGRGRRWPTTVDRRRQI
jgi:hypothetical protein